MTRPEEARNLLARKGWLSGTPEHFRRAVLSKAVVKHYAQGASIIMVGDEPRGVFGLADGGLRVSIAPAEMEPVFAYFFQPGSWFGEVPAITGRPHLIGLEATRETTMLHLPNHAWQEIVREDPAHWRYMGQLSVEHTEMCVGIIADLMRRDHTKRFTAIMLRLAGCRQPDSEPVEIDYSQEDLAIIANLGRTTVNGLLNKLQERGMVDVNYRRIRIVDPDGMRAFIAD
ncbi:MAG: Crp/Fnr family transcriptional regulator [Beijerinckiaceae bacterium]